MQIQIIGEVKSIQSEGVQITPTFLKRSIVVETVDDKYPQNYQIDAINNNMGIFDACNVGDKISLDCNLNGREYIKKDGSGLGYFISINTWRLDVIKKGNLGDSTPKPDAPKFEVTQENNTFEEDDENPLPF